MLSGLILFTKLTYASSQHCFKLVIHALALLGGNLCWPLLGPKGLSKME